MLYPDNLFSKKRGCVNCSKCLTIQKNFAIACKRKINIVGFGFMKTLCITTALLLFAGLYPLPIGYYTFLRIAVTIGCIAVIATEYKKRNHSWCILFVIIGWLFNPLIPVYLYEKSRWIPIDMTCGVLFLAVAFKPFQSDKE